MMRTILALIMVLLTADAAAQDIVCHTAPTPTLGGPHWYWRHFQGRACWYIGPRMVDRSRLYWPPAPEWKPPIDEDPPPPMPVNEFDDRWSGLHDHRIARDPQPITEWNDLFRKGKDHESAQDVVSRRW